MTYVIAKRSSKSLDFHLWREGSRIKEFGSETDALTYMAELVQQFGMDSLILLRRVDVSFKVEVSSNDSN